MMTFTFVLTAAEAQTVIEALSQLPYCAVAKLIDSLHEQAGAQVAPDDGEDQASASHSAPPSASITQPCPTVLPPAE